MDECPFNKFLNELDNLIELHKFHLNAGKVGSMLIWKASLLLYCCSKNQSYFEINEIIQTSVNEGKIDAEKLKKEQNNE